jgi:hypothetical protein
MLLIGIAGILLVSGAIRGSMAEEAKQEAKPSCLTSDGAVIRMSETSFMRINYQSQLAFAWRDTGSGRDGTDPTSDFYFRRNRLTVSGQASEIVSYDIKFEQMGPRRIGAVDIADEPVDDFEVLEASVDAELDKALHVKAGKMKIPFTREVLKVASVPCRSTALCSSPRPCRERGTPGSSSGEA